MMTTRQEHNFIIIIIISQPVCYAMTCNLNEFRGFHGANKSCSGDTPATRIYFFGSHRSVVNINEEEEGHGNAVSCLTLLLGLTERTLARTGGRNGS